MIFLLDIIFAAIILLAVFIGFKKGFVKLVLSLAVLIVSIYIASAVSPVLSGYVSDKFIEPSLVSKAQSIIEGSADDCEILPDYITENIDGFDFASLKETLMTANEKYGEAAAQKIVETNISPEVEKIINPIVNVILFVILSSILSVAAHFIGKLINITFLGGLNRILGAFLGCFNGFLIVYIICLLISVILVLNPGGFAGINSENVDNSYFYRLLTGIIGKF